MFSHSYWTPIGPALPEQERVRYKWAGYAQPLLIVKSPVQSVLSGMPMPGTQA